MLPDGQAQHVLRRLLERRSFLSAGHPEWRTPPPHTHRQGEAEQARVVGHVLPQHQLQLDLQGAGSSVSVLQARPVSLVGCRPRLLLPLHISSARARAWASGLSVVGARRLLGVLDSVRNTRGSSSASTKATRMGSIIPSGSSMLPGAAWHRARDGAC